MLRNDLYAVYFVSGYLFLYDILLMFPATFPYAVILLLFSPVLIAWMVYTVLRWGKPVKRVDDDDKLFHNFYNKEKSKQ